MKSYEELIGRHEGNNAFVLGAGPSLWFNMFNPVFSYLHTYGITIAVNSAVLADPVFDYWISNDALCRRWSWWDMVKKGHGEKVVRDSWLKHKKDISGFYIFKPRPTSEDIINPEDKGLCYCSSVPSGIDLAIQMGCKNIFVLGLDQSLDKNGKHHFWQYMNKKPIAKPAAQGSWSQQEKVFDINNMAFMALEEFAQQKKVHIYNVSRMEGDHNHWMTKVDVFDITTMNMIEKIIEV